MGGQALNIWAERYYSSAEDLAAFGPYTTKDIDYFGHRQAADKLAAAIGGRVRVPPIDNDSPESAVIEAEIDGLEIRIDFLTHILGVDDQQIKKGAVQIVMKVRVDQEIAELKLPIMHPFHCMQSRVANYIKLGRHHDVAMRQLEASPIVVREYIWEMLDLGDHREATETLEQVFEYLRSDTHGRQAHRIMKNDPALILDYFAEDERIDARYRAKSFANMRTKLAERRSAWARIKNLIVPPRRD